MTALLDLGGVSYGVAARGLVNDLTLGVDPGEIVTLVGPNGAGKTTTVRLVSGEVEAQGGTIRLGGGEIGSLNALEAARRRAVLPQQTTVRFPFLARDIVAMGRFPLDTDRETDFEACRAMMRRTDTTHLAESFYPVLSGGEQARVNLARVLVQEAPLIVLDEPVSAMDVRHELLVMRLLREAADDGAGCLVVLHDLNLAAANADRIALMHEGRLVAVGSVEEVLDAGLLSEVYQQPLSVIPHPERDGLLVLVRDG
ncbi:MAG: heme ABC transporter ATP-binding protein [Acidimicrobiia bacterium]|nr:heme ABC transporter ATP-binding protein [Acidimicrobiia bacterium]